MPFKIALLWTDIVFWGLLGLLLAAIIYTRVRAYQTHTNTISPWKQVWHNRLGLASGIILIGYLLITGLDSIHFYLALEHPVEAGVPTAVLPTNLTHPYSHDLKSIIDVLMAPQDMPLERTYVPPLTPLSAIPGIDNSVTHPFMRACLWGGGIAGVLLMVLCIGFAVFKRLSFPASLKKMWSSHTHNRHEICWKTLIITLLGVVFSLVFLFVLSRYYHIFGTDKVGQDVFYQSIKSIRTAILIGGITTLVAIPFALLFGTFAGYFGGIIDDAIQYIYVTLSSIPSVLLIVAFLLMLDVWLNRGAADLDFVTRADARLLLLCLILGITSWTSLCRLLRAETLKLRTMAYVEAGIVLGARPLSIIFRHIVPNLMHIILITSILDFSGLVLVEAVLSYVGVGVDPTMISFGNMINRARLELAREPVVWWSLSSAFAFMLLLVLATNLFADVVRDAFDPRSKMSAGRS